MKYMREVETTLNSVRADLDSFDNCPFGETNKLLDKMTMSLDRALKLLAEQQAAALMAQAEDEGQ